MMKYILWGGAMLFFISVKGQIPRSSPLYREIKNLDSLIFEVGFNQCTLTPYDSLIGEDIEFYHDKGGITTGKAAFIASMKNGICNTPFKIKRYLTIAASRYSLYSGKKYYTEPYSREHTGFLNIRTNNGPIRALPGLPIYGCLKIIAGNYNGC